MLMHSPWIKLSNIMSDKLSYATLGAGCFWCIEAVFQRLKGVESVDSGYSGGQLMNPTYQQITTGTTGHAEVARIAYDSSVISFEELLEVFWKTHDPTTLNRQGADVGTQYRSAIFYHDENQQKIATEYLKQLDASGDFTNPIVTEITALKNYYEADDSHKDYYNQHTSQGYCQYVIAPKIQKLKHSFKDKLKE
jgi:peptide-methionine (S)-S-oxide reductase